MKKILALIMLSALPAFTHTMNSVTKPVQLSTIINLPDLEILYGGDPLVKYRTSPDNTKIAIISEDGYVSLRNAQSGVLINGWNSTEVKNLIKSISFYSENVSISFNHAATKIIITTPNGSEELDIY